ncbi:MAG: rhamnulokinase [Streptosporangiaceae bacterium]
MAAGTVTVAAVDLGASSGRVITGRVATGRNGRTDLSLREAYRFRNEPVMAGGTLHWDILRLYGDLLTGLRRAGREAELSSIGIDSWGVDYGLLDASGALLGNPVHYRDQRTAGVMERVQASIPPADLYAATGIQQLPFNTIYQLVAAAGSPQLSSARTLLLIPDLLGWWLTGRAGAEVTNASTTQLLEIHSRTWAAPLIRRVGLNPELFPPLRQPGETIGALLPDAATSAGLRPDANVPVIAVGSHDTASAVAAVPATGSSFAYISSGTWSLVGMELDGPVLTEASRVANFTNEAGIDGTTRYLRNVMGLWLLQEAMRCWEDAGQPTDLDDLMAQAARVSPLRSVIDVGDPDFLRPGDMPARIAAAAAASGQPAPAAKAEISRCILDSLALSYRRAVRDVQALSGRHADIVHIVGGGARNELLCQLTADACRLPVLAGPAEATAIGNVLVQARAHGAAPGDLAGFRSLIRATQQARPFWPAQRADLWQSAAQRLARS